MPELSQGMWIPENNLTIGKVTGIAARKATALNDLDHLHITIVAVMSAVSWMFFVSSETSVFFIDFRYCKYDGEAKHGEWNTSLTTTTKMKKMTMTSTLRLSTWKP